jgi:peptidoglycan/LPS O-acetylase OafA/YrhL
MSLKYRPEIDGLRAFAVVAVILYHAQFVFHDKLLFTGGFLGVDVFFVISGYLIASLLLIHLHEGHFSIARFYQRRARRILPALFTVMGCSIPAAWFIMLPEQMKEYAKSVLSALFFGSNFFFWKEDHYAAAASMFKPFLHTWSLSVEEQFYVIFPLMLFLIWKFARPYLVGLFVLGFLFLLQLAQFGSTHFPDATFYLLPARGWELLAGVLLACMERDKGRVSHTFLDVTMPALGLFLIAHSVMFLNDTMKHPSFITLLPVIGTMLLIWFAKKGELVTDILSSKIFVGVGLISYSLYLWHFPVFSFVRIARAQEVLPLDFNKYIYIALSFALATASYFLVERPFRNKKYSSRKLIYILIVFFAVLVGVFSNIYASDGALYRLQGPLRAVYDESKIAEYIRLTSDVEGKDFSSGKMTPSCRMRDPETACVFGPGTLVTLGDSFVGHFETAITQHPDFNRLGLMSFNYDQCPLISPDLWFGDVTECPAINKKRWEVIGRFKTRKIFIVSANEEQFSKAKRMAHQSKNGEAEIENPPSAQVFAGLVENVEKLLDAGHVVVFVYTMPHPGRDGVGLFFNHAVRHGMMSDVPTDNIFVNEDAWSRVKHDDDLFDLKDRKNLIKIYPRDYLCRAEDDHKCLLVSRDGPIYNAGQHLSIFGARIIVGGIFRELERRGLVPK